MSCSAPTAISVSNVPNGSVTVATAAPNVRLDVRIAMKNARSVQAMSFASTAGSALIA